MDATDSESEAIGAPGCIVAHARLTIERSTVIGQVQVHSIDLAEDSIFDGKVTVARRQQGCMRFCYVTPGSRTPRRYQCQPGSRGERQNRRGESSGRNAGETRFNSERYGRPDYCQLADDCAEEITRGASDESEMACFTICISRSAWQI